MREENKIVSQEIDGVSFKLKEKADFSFLSKFGRVFCVFDQNDSGNISFGVENTTGQKFFIKVAGAKTVESFQSPEQAVVSLKETIVIYEKLRHDRLIELITSGSFQNLFFVVFKWSEGECLFDHWNFDYYSKHPEVSSPKEKFNRLLLKEKIKVSKQILDFATHVESKNYGLVDFYDGSLMYDFEENTLTICDIDLFKERPFINHMGIDYWGTKRVKAPEEYENGARIDERTAVFTIGALFFNLYGKYSKEELAEIYKENCFIPVEKKNWSLSEDLYDIALKAVNALPENRYSTVFEFQDKWLEALNI